MAVQELQYGADGKTYTRTLDKVNVSQQILDHCPDQRFQEDRRIQSAASTGDCRQNCDVLRWLRENS